MPHALAPLHTAPPPFPPPRVLREISDWSDFQLHEFALEHPAALADFTLGPETLLQSGKLVALEGLLAELQQRGSRALVFSQWTSILDILQWFLDEVGGAGCVCVRGGEWLVVAAVGLGRGCCC